MSAAAAADPANAGEAPKGGKKKLLIIVAAVLLLLVIGGIAAFLMLRTPAAAEEGAEGSETTAQVERAEDEEKVPPVFVPLEPFVVNLADADADRFVQVGITLQVIDQHRGDEIKLYLPAIRNNILLLLAKKTSAELQAAEGKELLAKQIRRASVEPLGFKLPDPEAEAAKQEGTKKKKPAKKETKKKSEQDIPVSAVLFSSFVIQ